MSKLTLKRDSSVKAKFASYPKAVKAKLEFLRALIVETASEQEDINEMEETLKWGEPSYLVKKGSTIRMDWKKKNPGQYAMYFKCTSKLVPTFREVYGDLFTYENNRAILFGLEAEVPVAELKDCIRLALTYHSVKHIPRLGK
jgi:uncharacterized protein YdhG (YjbR/CyaY superfamily)